MTLAGDERTREDGSADPAAGERALEQSFWARGVRRVAGVDEAGRGPLAGPVVAAAVVLGPDCRIDGADDSKRLAPEVREELAGQIEAEALGIGIGAASAREVDRLNILRATHLAMRRAVDRLEVEPEHVIVDGLAVPTLGDAQTAVVQGDRRVHCISCASIIAKVTRDRLMHRLAPRYPGYGWHTNVGYGTPEHRDALARLGPTPHHRRSFAPVQLSLDLDA